MGWWLVRGQTWKNSLCNATIAVHVPQDSDDVPRPEGRVLKCMRLGTEETRSGEGVITEKYRCLKCEWIPTVQKAKHDLPQQSLEPLQRFSSHWPTLHLISGTHQKSPEISISLACYIHPLTKLCCWQPLKLFKCPFLSICPSLLRR